MTERAAVHPYPSAITLNINRLNSPIKTQYLNRLKKINKIQLHAAYERLTSALGLRVKRWKKIFHINGNQNMCVSAKTDFKSQTVTKTKVITE